MAKTNKATLIARDSLVISGITKDLKTTSSMPIAGKAYKPIALIALIQSRITAMNAAAAARAQWLDAVKTVNALNTQVNEARAIPDLATRTQAVAKGAATRIARGTLSTKEKAKIHGAVAVATEPVATPAPMAPSAPAPAGAKS
jgi:hypothetical protein